MKSRTKLFTQTLLSFSSRFVTLNETLDRVDEFNPKKASQATDIPVKIIKENKDYHFTFFIISTMSYQVALFQLR